jgi:hypothetical protein
VQQEKLNAVQWCNHKNYVEEWLMDSGATINITRSDNCFENITACNQMITVGNGDKVNMLKQGDHGNAN